MSAKEYKLRIREADREIFEAIKNGLKKVETRAATDRYRKIQVGDVLVFVCGADTLKKRIVEASVFSNIGLMLKRYSVKEINPEISSQKDLEAMYFGFVGYKEKIEKFGLVAWRLD